MSSDSAPIPTGFFLDLGPPNAFSYVIGTLANGCGEVPPERPRSPCCHVRGPKAVRNLSIVPTLTQTGKRGTGRPPGARAVASTTTSARGLKGAKSVG